MIVDSCAPIIKRLLDEVTECGGALNQDVGFNFLLFLKVCKDNICLYREAAEELIESMGAETALATCLAKIGGHSDPFKVHRYIISRKLASHLASQTRSLLSSVEGYTTIQVKTPFEIRSVGYVFRILGQYLPEVCFVYLL